MLFNINTLEWDEELLNLFEIPRSMLPTVQPSASLFGYTDTEILGARLPIGSVAGDQQAALFGQCCFDVGELKNTYGTGSFLLMNTGKEPYLSSDGLITTVAWGIDGEITYALEGSVFTCGAAIQWLRDGLKVIDSAQDSEYYASKVSDSAGVTVVPAFTGLGAPYWDAYARGAIFGITRATNKNHIIRATLESIAYQTGDVVELMEKSTEIKAKSIKVDGGASANNLMLGFQADILGIAVERPKCIETTALGVAYMCALTLGIYKSLDEIKKNRSVDRLFTPNMENTERQKRITVWKKAVSRSLLWCED
jgi:glycerol kinase